MNRVGMWLCVLATAVVVASREVRSEPPSPRIGVILPLSGPLAALGSKVRNGILLAAEAEGLPENALVFEDGEFSNTKAMSALNKLITVDRIDGLVGPFGPGQTSAIAGIVRSRKLPVVAVSLCSAGFRERTGAWCSYLAPADQAAPVLELFLRCGFTTASDRFGSIVEEVDGFEEYRTAFAAFARRVGGAVIHDERFDGSARDFRSTLLSMKTRRVSVLAIGAVDPKTAELILRQAREIGFEPSIRWLFTERNDDVFGASPRLFDGLWYLSLGRIAPEFRKRVTDRFGISADLYPAIGHDAARSLIRAVKEPGNGLEATLLSMRPEGSAFEGFRFDLEKGVTMESDIARLDDGRVEFVTEGECPR